jgi:hypothetical protein
MRSKDSTVGLVTKLWSGQKESLGSILRKSKKFFPSRNFKTGYVIYPNSYSTDTKNTKTGVKLDIQSTSAGAMNEWSYTSTHYMPLWRAEGQFTYSSMPITVDYIDEYVST